MKFFLSRGQIFELPLSNLETVPFDEALIFGWHNFFFQLFDLVRFSLYIAVVFYFMLAGFVFVAFLASCFVLFDPFEFLLANAFLCLMEDPPLSRLLGLIVVSTMVTCAVSADVVSFRLNELNQG